MNVFDAVKQSVTTRQAAEMYGLRIRRNNMASCPFHNDRSSNYWLTAFVTNRTFYVFHTSLSQNDSTQQHERTNNYCFNKIHVFHIFLFIRSRITSIYDIIIRIFSSIRSKIISLGYRLIGFHHNFIR